MPTKSCAGTWTALAGYPEYQFRIINMNFFLINNSETGDLQRIFCHDFFSFSGKISGIKRTQAGTSTSSSPKERRRDSGSIRIRWDPPLQQQIGGQDLRKWSTCQHSSAYSSWGRWIGKYTQIPGLRAVHRNRNDTKKRSYIPRCNLRHHPNRKSADFSLPSLHRGDTSGN